MDAYKLRERAWEHLEMSLRYAPETVESEAHYRTSVILYRRAAELEREAFAPAPSTAVIL